MAWALGSTVVLALTAVASAASPPHSAQHQLPEGQATIRGPGLDQPLDLTGQPYFDLVYLAGLVPEWSPPPPGQRDAPPSGVRLGPAYDLFYSFPVPGQGPVPLVQTLYFGKPAGGVWVNTLAGQGIPLAGGGRLEVPEGWWRSQVLDDFLRSAALAEGLTGFPPEDTQTNSDLETIGTSRPNTDPSPTTEEPSTTTRVLLGLATLGLLLLIGAVEGRLGAIVRTPQ
jgi:hypothetical protein